MFNSCVISGVVLTEPDLKLYEGHADTVFKLGLMIGQFKAGYVTVRCPQKLAEVASNLLHRGDRVALAGVIGRYEDPAKLQQPFELVFIAQDLELIRPDSPRLGLTALEKIPKP
jgi:hypothetical protein